MTPEGDTIFIKVRGLHQQFGAQKVLKGVDLDVMRGETLVLLGGSGGGKSVLIKHFLGLLQPDAGTVVVDDEDITDLPERKLVNVRRKVSMMFQGGALFDSLTVGENVAFPLREAGIRDENTKCLAILSFGHPHGPQLLGKARSNSPVGEVLLNATIQALVLSDDLQARASAHCVIGQSQHDTLGVGVIGHLVARAIAESTPHISAVRCISALAVCVLPATTVVGRGLGCVIAPMNAERAHLRRLWLCEKLPHGSNNAH